MATDLMTIHQAQIKNKLNQISAYNEKKSKD